MKVQIDQISCSDIELVHLLLNGDQHSLYRLYTKYKDILLLFIRSKIAKETDVEEVFQDTFFAFLESLRDFHGQCQVKTYLYAICQHKIIDFYRKKKIKHVVFSQFPQLESLVSPLLEPEAQFDQQEYAQKVKVAFSRLTPMYQKLLHYKYVEGRSVGEIATLLSLSFKSVESKLFRARKAFAVVWAHL